MDKAIFNLGIILSAEEMAVLKGGVAEVSDVKEETSSSGDGAEYVCCIKIELPFKSMMD